MSENVQWRFGVVGNITKSHLDENGEVRYGTKAFTGGTKVFLYGKNWDSSQAEICVVGRNRFDRLAFEWVSVEHIENVRAQRIFEPNVLDFIWCEENMKGADWWERTSSDRKATKQFVKDWLART